MQNSMMLFTFFVFDWKYPFWANLVQKIRIINLSWNLVPRLIQICRIQWPCSLFLFLTGTTYFGQFGPKSQNYHFKLNFGGQSNSNMQNSMMLFTFFVFDRKYPVTANLFQKIRIINLSSNVVPRVIRICKI